jgi:hypothetical protein
MEVHMSTSLKFAHPSGSRYAAARFVLVNHRIPRADARCALCDRKIGEGYVREPLTRLLYCDTQCFAGHAKMTTLDIEKQARKVS